MTSRTGRSSSDGWASAWVIRLPSISPPTDRPSSTTGIWLTPQVLIRLSAWRTAAAGATLTSGGALGRPALEQLLDRRPRRLQHLVLLHPLVVEDLGEVALAGVAEDGDDQRGGVVHLAGDLQRERHVQSRWIRRPGSLPPAPAGGPWLSEVRSGTCRNSSIVVEPDGGRGSCRRRSPRPCRDGPRPASGSGGSGCRASPIGSPATTRIFGFFSFRYLPGAAHRAAGAGSRHQVGHLALGLLPDLRAGGGVVGLGVDRVVELIGQDRARVSPSRSAWPS